VTKRKEGRLYGISPSSHNNLGTAGSENSSSGFKSVPKAGHTKVNRTSIWAGEIPV